MRLGGLGIFTATKDRMSHLCNLSDLFMSQRRGMAGRVCGQYVSNNSVLFQKLLLVKDQTSRGVWMTLQIH